MIEPRTLKGFRDFLPPAMLARERLIDTARCVYRSFGFCPIDTPALEYLEVLLGKGSEETDRLLYQFRDHGDRAVGMRFDLTVPLARFVAQHIHELGTPFKRYHIGTVWRGENTHRGRYREFVQCDFDTIGTASMVADIETVLVVHSLFLALGVSEFTIRMNNRRILTGLLERLGLLDQATVLLRALDKLPKIGREKVAAEMMAVAGASAQQADDVLDLTSLQGESETILTQLEEMLAGNATGSLGVKQLREVLVGVAAAGVPTGRIQLDLSIARGLDYYTGTVIETFLDRLPSIGSVCSGGRYDNLAQLFTTRELPGIGASLGLDRLLAALDELQQTQATFTPAPVFLPYFDAAHLKDYLRLAAQIRENGIGVEFYPEVKKIGQQLKYADQRGFRLAVIAGDREFAAGRCQLKNLQTRDSEEVEMDGDGVRLVSAIRRMLTVGVGLIASLPAIVWAQGAEEESKGPEWVLNYATVVLCVGLALAIICRMGKRSKEIKVTDGG